MKKYIIIICFILFLSKIYAQENITVLDGVKVPKIALSSHDESSKNKKEKRINTFKRNKITLHVSTKTLRFNTNKYGFISGLEYRYFLYENLFISADYTYLRNDVTDDFFEDELVSAYLKENIFVVGAGFNLLKSNGNCLYVSLAMGCGYQQFNKEMLRANSRTVVDEVKEKKLRFAFSPSFGYSYYFNDYFDVGVNMMLHSVNRDWAGSLNLTVGLNF